MIDADSSPADRARDFANRIVSASGLQDALPQLVVFPRCDACKHAVALIAGQQYECELTEFRQEGYNRHPETLAVARGDEGYGAILYVAPNFGCVQWEKK